MWNAPDRSRWVSSGINLVKTWYGEIGEDFTWERREEQAEVERLILDTETSDREWPQLRRVYHVTLQLHYHYQQSRPHSLLWPLAGDSGAEPEHRLEDSASSRNICWYSADFEPWTEQISDKCFEIKFVVFIRNSLAFPAGWVLHTVSCWQDWMSSSVRLNLRRCLRPRSVREQSLRLTREIWSVPSDWDLVSLNLPVSPSSVSEWTCRQCPI